MWRARACRRAGGRRARCLAPPRDPVRGDPVATPPGPDERAPSHSPDSTGRARGSPSRSACTPRNEVTAPVSPSQAQTPRISADWLSKRRAREGGRRRVEGRRPRLVRGRSGAVLQRRVDVVRPRYVARSLARLRRAREARAAPRSSRRSRGALLLVGEGGGRVLGAIRGRTGWECAIPRAASRCPEAAEVETLDSRSAASLMRALGGPLVPARTKNHGNLPR